MFRPTRAQELWETVADKAGASLDEATRTGRALLELLGPSLSVPARSELATLEGLDVDLLGAGDDAPTSVDDLVNRASARAHVSPSHALELALVTARALVDICEGPPAGTEAPAAIRALFEDREPAEEMPPPPPRDKPLLTRPRSLAEGRPGAERPLSEAHGVPAQSGSVVTDDNPHAASKMSSVKRDHTLADGKPR